MFNPLYQTYNANRYCVTARNGMVTTGFTLESDAGLKILKMGGNKFDIALNLTVVESTENAI